MSITRKCDCCGVTIEVETGPYAELIVYGVNDGYNSESYNCYLDICAKCLRDKFTKDEVINGRSF